MSLDQAKAHLPRWPLMPVDPEIVEGCETIFFLSDAQMIMIKVLLRHACNTLQTDDALSRSYEALRNKFEQALDVEFHEGRFSEDVVETK